MLPVTNPKILKKIDNEKQRKEAPNILSSKEYLLKNINVNITIKNTINNHPKIPFVTLFAYATIPEKFLVVVKFVKFVTILYLFTKNNR